MSLAADRVRAAGPTRRAGLTSGSSCLRRSPSKQVGWTKRAGKKKNTLVDLVLRVATAGGFARFLDDLDFAPPRRPRAGHEAPGTGAARRKSVKRPPGSKLRATLLRPASCSGLLQTGAAFHGCLRSPASSAYYDRTRGFRGRVGGLDACESSALFKHRRLAVVGLSPNLPDEGATICPSSISPARFLDSVASFPAAGGAGRQVIYGAGCRVLWGSRKRAPRDVRAWGLVCCADVRDELASRCCSGFAFSSHSGSGGCLGVWLGGLSVFRSARLLTMPSGGLSVCSA